MPLIRPRPAELAAGFAAAMDRLGPFEPSPALAVAVSGGADSMALAMLAADWAGDQEGSVLALVVDHGLRPASANEARVTIERLAGLGIAGRLLTLVNLRHGPALAERARTGRYEILAKAVSEAGILHLLLGHHAGDQMETVAMRALRGSQTHGLAGMPALRETAGLRLLRPLLALDPAILREFLVDRCVGWLEDPSNRDIRATRTRLRLGFKAASVPEADVRRALSAAGHWRRREEAALATELANRATIRPEGFALLSPGRISATALRALIQMVAGSAYPPSQDRVAELAERPEPATLGGVRLLAAGRLGDGLLLTREEAAISAPIAADDGVVWDRRFRLIARRQPPAGATVGKLGDDAARLRHGSDLPSAVLRTLPAIRLGENLVSVPHLGYVSRENDLRMNFLSYANTPAAGPCFFPSD